MIMNCATCHSLLQKFLYPLIIDDLKKMNTYDEGYVHLTQDMFHRGENNDVISISNNN